MVTSDVNIGSTIKNEDLDSIVLKLRKRQNIRLAIVGGLSAFLFCSALWALISLITDYQVTYMAIGIGLIVGFAVRYSGQGYRWKYGLIGAIYSFLSIIVGNLLMVTLYVSHSENIQFSDLLLSLDFSVILAILWSIFKPSDLLFYGIAIYLGFKISYRRSNYKI